MFTGAKRRDLGKLMEKLFEGKVAIVTGGTGEIGEAVINRLTQHGANVISDERNHGSGLVRETVKCFGKLDALIDLDIGRRWRQRIAPAKTRDSLISTALPHLQMAGGRGSAVFMLNVLEFANSDFTFQVIKGILAGYMKSLVSTNNVRFNLVVANYIDSGLGGISEEQRKALVTRSDMKRLGSVEEVVTPVTFLASVESSYINGQTLYVGGGLSGA